jgi:hypothetical protein
MHLLDELRDTSVFSLTFFYFLFLPLALISCSAPQVEGTPTPVAEPLLPASPSAVLAVDTPTENPFDFVPPLFAGATATPLANAAIETRAGFEVWNPHQTEVFLLFDPSEWVLMVGGDPAPFLYEGFQGLFHRTMDSCILSISGATRAPIDMEGAFELLDLGDYPGEKQTWRDAALVRRFLIYRIIEPEFNWGFLLGSTGITVTMPCIQAAEQVLDTITIISP